MRWCVTYKLSYRDLAAMMLERGVAVAPNTIFRWVQRYVPELEKRWDRFSRPIGCSGALTRPIGPTDDRSLFDRGPTRETRPALRQVPLRRVAMPR
jgi:hypothetical protein